MGRNLMATKKNGKNSDKIMISQTNNSSNPTISKKGNSSVIRTKTQLEKRKCKQNGGRYSGQTGYL